MPSSWKPSVKSSQQWCDHFAANAPNQRPMPWHEGAQATPAELAEIADSLCAWQLAETSDGAHLRAAAANYASRIGDPTFLQAVERFITEENRHGALLGRYLDLAGVPRVKAAWSDTLFRKARYLLPSMEVWVTPVVMVETHAFIYYNAIRHATKCPLLRLICTQLLADEVPHIRFQCERLAILHRRRPRWLRGLTMAIHRVFFLAITMLIWMGHRRALKAGGYGFGRFWRSAWAKMRYTWQIMDPEAYRWNADVEANSIPPGRALLKNA